MTMGEVVPGPGTLQFALDSINDPVLQKVKDQQPLTPEDQNHLREKMGLPGPEHVPWGHGPWKRDDPDMLALDYLKDTTVFGSCDKETDEYLENTIWEWYRGVRLAFQECGCQNCMQIGEAKTMTAPAAIARGERHYAAVMNKRLPRGWRKQPKVLALIAKFDQELKAAGNDLMRTARGDNYAGDTAPEATGPIGKEWTLREWPREYSW